MEEHKTAATLPSEMTALSVQEPSSYVVQFLDFLHEQNIKNGKLVDIGAGKGRNTIYLAKQGFEVCALDYVQEAVDFISKVAKKEKLKSKVHALSNSIDTDWPFADNEFDVAIDCFASIDVETKIGREKYRNELQRTLKPGGYALVVVVSSDDEIEGELIKTSPGKEKNSSIWPANNKFQKNYDETELREFYKDFQIVSLKKIQKPAHKLGKDFTASNFWLVVKKK